jgi:AcrR family transcriptional regulator
VTKARTEGTKPQVATPVVSRPLRRDAERNRQLILDTAKSVFAHRGLDASLDEVAHEAGLGVGTVYRRFPNRDALIDALFEDMLTSITHIVAESLELSRAWDGLVHFMTAMLESQGRDKALRDLMLSRPRHLEQCEQDKEEVVRDTIEPALFSLIDRAKQEGDLRTDVVATDVGTLLIAAVGVVDFTAPADPEVWRRYLTVMLDGLRARPAGETSVLTPEPLDDEQLEVCMSGWKYGTRETTRRRS